MAKEGSDDMVLGRSAPTTEVKRTHKETEEGKYAVCPSCGQLSSDYNICEGCTKMLPDKPRYYCPERSKIPRRTTPLQDGDQTEEGKYAVCPNCGQLSCNYNICEGCNTLLPEEPHYYCSQTFTRIENSSTPRTVAKAKAANNTPRPTTPLQDKTKADGKKSSGSDRMMRAAQYEDGGPEKLFFGEAPMPQLKAHEVLIKVHATAINRADTLQRKGKYAPPEGASPILGLEAAGHVHQVSAEATKWEIGDRVMALLSGGGNAEYATVHEDHLLPIPVGMSHTEAAAIPEVWLTAYQILHLVGGVKAGDFVLIHAGGSGVGTAAVQLARLAGARPIVTAGSQVKLDKAISLGAEHGFNYKEGPWEENVKKATDGHGADVILDCVGSSYWEQNVGTLANDGRWVLYGLLGGSRVEGDILAKLMRKRGTLAATTLRTRSTKYKADLVAAFTKEALPHFASGNLKPIIDQTFPVEEISAAHMTMESNTNSGKIVLIIINEEGPNDKSEL